MCDLHINRPMTDRRRITSHAEAIDLWPSVVVLADDLNLPLSTVRSWRERDSIPSAHWPAVVAAAQARKLRAVTTPILQTIQTDRDRRRREVRNQSAQSARTVIPHAAPTQDGVTRTPRKQSLTDARG